MGHWFEKIPTQGAFEADFGCRECAHLGTLFRIERSPCFEPSFSIWRMAFFINSSPMVLILGRSQRCQVGWPNRTRSPWC